MTKQEERNILGQMRKLAEPTFYIAETFDKVWEIAEQNIDDDSVCNPVKDRQAEFERKLKEDAERGARIVNLERQVECAQSYAQGLEERIFTLEKVCESKDAQISELLRDATGCGEELARVRKIAAEQELTIRELKAKLYDYMVREGN